MNFTGIEDFDAALDGLIEKGLVKVVGRDDKGNATYQLAEGINLAQWEQKMKDE